jgi:hypothetical protein
MNTRTVQLIDESRNVLARAEVTDEGEYYGGTIDLACTPPRVRLLFEEFEEIVNGQMFSFLDAIQERVGALAIKVVFDDGCEAQVKDLQVFPSAGEVSFKLAEVVAPRT